MEDWRIGGLVFNSFSWSGGVKMGPEITLEGGLVPWEPWWEDLGCILEDLVFRRLRFDESIEDLRVPKVPREVLIQGQWD